MARAPLLLALWSLSAGADPVAEVRIAAYRFQPPVITIKAGEIIRWVNHEKRTSHSIVFPAEGGLESERLFPQESWERRFDRPGRHDYHCGPHPEMKGVVVVGE